MPTLLQASISSVPAGAVSLLAVDSEIYVSHEFCDWAIESLSD